jgi:hypothetical protein
MAPHLPREVPLPHRQIEMLRLLLPLAVGLAVASQPSTCSVGTASCMTHGALKGVLAYNKGLTVRWAQPSSLTLPPLTLWRC